MLNRSSILAVLFILIPATCFAQASGSLLIGQGSGVAPQYTPMSGDALITNTGALTVTKSTFASPTFTGTMSFPDGSTYTTAGHNNMKTLGVGTTAPTVSTMAVFQGNYNNNTNIEVNNATAGASAFATLYLNNDLSHYGAFQLGSSLSGDSLGISTNAANGIGLGTAASSGTAPITFSIASSTIGQFTPAGLNVIGLTIGGTALGGTCGGGQFVSAISNGVVPTCTTPPSLATPVSIANGGTGTSTAPTAGQLLIAQSGTSYSPIALSGDGTLSSAGVITITKINGTTPGGACTGNQYVLSISASGVPTCGSLLAPLASPTFTGTVTMPDASTIASTGYSNAKAISIGAAMVAGDPLDVTNNVNAGTGGQIINSNTGTGAFASWIASNGTSTATMEVAGTGYTANPNIPANMAVFTGNAAAGVGIFALNSAGPIKLWAGGHFAGSFSGSGLDVLGLTIGGNPIGGTCSAGTFVSSINASGVPTCTTPAGGGTVTSIVAGTGLTGGTITTTGTIALATPVSIANGGTNTSTAPTTGQILTAQSASAYGPVSLSGDATITSAGAITVTKTSGTAFSTLATATTPLSIANGGRGSSTAPSVGQIDVASSTTAFTPVTMSGDGTLTSAGVLTVTKLNGTVPGGSCTGNQYVLTVSSSGVPTCGSLLAPLASPTFTGTVSMPDGSTITSAGYNNVKTLGVGTTAPTVSTMAVFSFNANNNTSIQVNNATAGASAFATVYVNNDLGHYGAIQIGSSTSGGGTADEYLVQTNTANGMNVSSTTGGSTIQFGVGGASIASVTSTGINIASTANNYFLGGTQLFQGAGTSAGGSWTPSLKFAGANVGVTYAAVTGNWAISGKIGVVEMVISLTSKGTSTGAATVTGLPSVMTASTVSAAAYGVCAVVTGMSIASTYRITPQVAPSNTITLLADNGGQSSSNQVGLTDANFTNTANIQCKISYIVQ